MCRALVGLLLMLLGYIFHVLHNVMRLLFRLLVLLRYLPRYLSSGVRKKKRKKERSGDYAFQGLYSAGRVAPALSPSLTTVTPNACRMMEPTSPRIRRIRALASAIMAVL